MKSWAYLILAFFFFSLQSFSSVTVPAFNYYTIFNKTEDTSPANGDFVITADVSATLLKKVKLSSLVPLTTKGDLLVHNGTSSVRLGVGTNNYVLMADSAQTTGLKYVEATDQSTNSAIMQRDSGGGVEATSIKGSNGNIILNTTTAQLNTGGGAVQLDFSGSRTVSFRGIGIGNALLSPIIILESSTSATSHTMILPLNNFAGPMINNGSGQLSYANHYTTTLSPSGTTQTINWSNGASQRLDLGSASGDVTVTLSNPIAGVTYRILVVQGATPRDVVWPAAVLWANGQKLLLSSTNDAIDKVELYYDGTNYFGDWDQGYQ